MSTSEDSGLSIPYTPRNPFGLFYNCPRNYNIQCEFFHWSDEPAPTGDRHIDELNLIRNEFTRLRRTGKNIDMMSKSLTIQAEIDEIKERVRTVNESDLIPPIDKLLSADDEGDDAVLIQTI
ncbi:hypothetical protein MANES_10G075806v8 [Manihot esculenta]|uniref:Uncharacterized protein n=1 Tax=Manihot esculenta TaxID=3983 RepID=A0ACB7GZM1_MANES|nr:hypothetical protein MANES_10G075806v8 [Manihot esculenta]